MAKIDYEKVKALIQEKKPGVNVDDSVKKLRMKLKNLSLEGALLILANQAGVEVRTDKPQAIIKTIESLRDGDDFVEIAGAVVQVYDVKYYEVCPECAKRVRAQTGVFKCEAHGVINSPAYSYLQSLMLDDGTNNIRVTLFSRQMEKLYGMSAQQLVSLRNKPDQLTEMKDDLLGKLLAFKGSVKVDQAFSMRKEFNAKLVYKEVKDVQPRVDAVTNLIHQQDKIPHVEEEMDELDIPEEHIGK